MNIVASTSSGGPVMAPGRTSYGAVVVAVVDVEVDVEVPQTT
jgi:hypothetical protein